MKKALKLLLYITFVIYLAALNKILFGGFRGYIEYAFYSVNLVPFSTIMSYINAIANNTMNIDIPVKNLLGNLLLFLPMGIYLPCILKKLRSFKSTMLCIFILLVGVELIQFVTMRGAFDIDDLILNMLGALIGFIIFKSTLGQKLHSWLFN